ncbi:MAG: DUF4288 domain-containing protein [Anaerolineae bacterium]|jgi:hypothetical protein|nr:DUF4288 domain-containing protein [Anaerolineae bacterium]
MNSGWYLADYIEAFHNTVTDERWAHINMILVRADDPETAYQKAIQFGEYSNYNYVNSDNHLVEAKFHGFRNIYEIYDPLEDGSEILYEHHDDITEDDIKSWVKPKEKLAIFVPREEDD